MLVKLTTAKVHIFAPFPTDKTIRLPPVCISLLCEGNPLSRSPFQSKGKKHWLRELRATQIIYDTLRYFYDATISLEPYFALNQVFLDLQNCSINISNKKVKIT